VNNKEIDVLIGLIDMEQQGGAKWAHEGIWLDDIKRKLEEMKNEPQNQK